MNKLFSLNLIYITNITEYDNLTDEYNDTLSINNNCTNIDSNIEIIITLFTIKPCGLSFYLFKITYVIYLCQTFIQ